MLLLVFFVICRMVLAQPHCAKPPTRIPPKYFDCGQIIRLIEHKATYTEDEPVVASRRGGFDTQLPRSFNAAMTGNTCAVRLDMVEGREYAVDRFRFSDVAHAAQVILEECLAPRILAPATEGWMNIGRYRLINVTLEKSHSPSIQALNSSDGF